MFAPALALRGGYADGALRDCLEAQRQIDADELRSRWQESSLTLYKVDAGCVESRSAGAR
jgi:hypothetical protein